MDSHLPDNINPPSAVQPQPIPPPPPPSPSPTSPMKPVSLKRPIIPRLAPLFFILFTIIIFFSSFLYFSKQQIKSVKKIQSAPLTPTAPPPSPTPDLGTVLITMYPIPTDTPEEKSQAVNLSPVAFTIVAENDTFTPVQITARVGQIITLNFTARDKDYYIGIPQLGMSRTIKKGETKSLEFQAQTFGQFLFACVSGCNTTTAQGLLTIKR